MLLGARYLLEPIKNSSFKCLELKTGQLWRERKHIPHSQAQQAPPEITKGTCCLSWEEAGAGWGWGTCGAALCLRQVCPRADKPPRTSLGVSKHSRLSTSMSLTDATGKCPKIRGEALFFSSKGDSSPHTHIPCVQVKVTSERTGTFCKIECDHCII